MRTRHLLVGKSNQHHFKDEEETSWCRGKVIGIEKHNKNHPKRTQYSVTYDTDSDKHFSFPLLVELDKGEYHCAVGVEQTY